MKRLAVATKEDDLNMFKTGSTEAHVTVYAEDMINNHVMRELGVARRDFLSKQRPLIARFRFAIPPATVVDKTIQKYQNFTRDLMAWRIWLLDYQNIGDIAAIIEFADKELRAGVPARLGLRLRHIMRKLTEITSSRHMDEVVLQRTRLFAIVKELRDVENRYADKQNRQNQIREQRRAQGIEEAEQSVKAERDFPSSRLRKVEMNLMLAEVLSLQLVVRKALLMTPIIERTTLTKIRKLGFNPRFTALPGGEPDID
ncbi:hypothetical protein O1611_g2868 [Lasiodiplodia mahajangana]|uniref:Uncharacterized protein n=1 Tax=Lasiodiplodia mahajangana TaxID=1108764 RepID=A0ACC2JTC0_9PEZI|nr:hypothetical protein O1611_g2868 [Lasiodiplodia mahajangana]